MVERHRTYELDVGVRVQPHCIKLCHDSENLEIKRMRQ